MVAASGTLGPDGCSVSVHVSFAPKLAAKQLSRDCDGSAASNVFAIRKSAPNDVLSCTVQNAISVFFHCVGSFFEKVAVTLS